MPCRKRGDSGGTECRRDGSSGTTTTSLCGVPASCCGLTTEVCNCYSWGDGFSALKSRGIAARLDKIKSGTQVGHY